MSPVEIFEQRITLQLVRDFLRLDRSAHQPDDLEAVITMVGTGMGRTHIPQPHHQNLHFLRHSNLPPKGTATASSNCRRQLDGVVEHAGGDGVDVEGGEFFGEFVAVGV